MSRDIDPTRFFDGPVLVLAPHMDDESLGCGATVAQCARRALPHIVYCTDGRGILQPGRGPAHLTDAEQRIGSIRREETLRGLSVLGVPPGQARFLDFPEWQLARHADALREKLAGILQELRPRFVLAPFRFDKHTDHIALNLAVRRLRRAGQWAGTLLEYFVYYQWKLLPSGDIRACVRQERIVSVPIGEFSRQKRAALECHRSQTTAFFPWQHKPVLSAGLLDTFCAGSELFLASEEELPDSAVVSLPAWWLRLLNRLEPRLKNAKERALSRLHQRRSAQRS